MAWDLLATPLITYLLNAWDYDSRAMAYVAIVVIDDTELPGGYSLDGFVGLHDVAVPRAVIAVNAGYGGFEELRGMAVLESYRFVVTGHAFPGVAGYE